MEFYVKLIEVEPDLSEDEEKELKANCTFIKNNIWIYEGDEFFLDARFKVLSDGIVGPLGDYSQKELVILCKQTFIFDHSLLN
jgi:hypothetical protein